MDATLTFEPQGQLVFTEDNIGVEAFYTRTKPMLYRILGLPDHGEFHHIRNFERADSGNVIHDMVEAAQEWFTSLPKDARERRFVRNTQLDLDSEKSLENSLPPLFRLIRLRLHQLQAVATIIDRWVECDSKPFIRRPVYIADEVGLGKTLEVIALVAFVSGMMRLKQRGGVLPPIIGEVLCPTLTYVNLTTSPIYRGLTSPIWVQIPRRRTVPTPRPSQSRRPMG
jgi:hypothetical protein